MTTVLQGKQQNLSKQELQSHTVGSISSSSTATDFLFWGASWYPKHFSYKELSPLVVKNNTIALYLAKNIHNSLPLYKHSR